MTYATLSLTGLEKTHSITPQTLQAMSLALEGQCWWILALFNAHRCSCKPRTRPPSFLVICFTSVVLLFLLMCDSEGGYLPVFLVEASLYFFIGAF